MISTYINSLYFHLLKLLATKYKPNFFTTKTLRKLQLF